MLKVILIVMSLLSFKSRANEYKILTEFNLVTDHTEAQYRRNSEMIDYNEDNELISIGLAINDVSIGYSKFNNSFYNPSEIWTIDYKLISVWDFDFILGTGVVKGYTKYELASFLFINDDWAMMGFTTIRYAPDFLTYKGIYVNPKIRLMGINVILFNLEVGYYF